MSPFVIAAALAAATTFAVPTLAFADDPSKTCQHSGKSVDGKTDGTPEESAQTFGQ